jgi:hypothetical protein
MFTVLAVIACAISWIALGEWARGSSRRPREQSAAVERPSPEQLVASRVTMLPPALPTSQPMRPASLAAVPAPVAPRVAGSDIVKRTADEASAGIESLRSYIVSSCWPAGTAGATANLTFNLTFDAQGREIARGLAEGRRGSSAPAREFGRCLRRLEGTRLAIAPIGANVAVSVPVTFP